MEIPFAALAPVVVGLGVVVALAADVLMRLRRAERNSAALQAAEALRSASRRTRRPQLALVPPASVRPLPRQRAGNDQALRRQA